MCVCVCVCVFIFSSDDYIFLHPIKKSMELAVMGQKKYGKFVVLSCLAAIEHLLFIKFKTFVSSFISEEVKESVYFGWV